MKIAYPAAGIDEKYKCILSKDFVTSGLIGVFDTKEKSLHVYSKEELNTDFISWLEENKIEAIITPELQMMVYKVFSEKKIKVYKAMSDLIKLNVELFEADSLSLLSKWELKKKSACNSSTNCGSCSSSSCA